MSDINNRRDKINYYLDIAETVASTISTRTRIFNIFWTT